ncbi:MAG: hypothetical protein HF978_19095 [Desulfobacteraceae bacterium]|nr:hypothetical protein [Desulfobacteraceae bacterium]MBC2757656.1 hypothetical protein [Desulfobacteraceae bacterium]
MALKAIVAGLLCASAVTIMYSLAPMRPLVMKTVLSYKFLVPEAESLARKTLYYGGLTEAMRGQSLIGTSTITTGFLGTMWAFTFLAASNTMILVIGLAIVVLKVGWQSELFMVDRVFEKTQLAIENPYEEESFAQRLRSFTQPFSHLLEHPFWLIAGAGRIGQKLSSRGNVEAELRDLAGLSKHSGFGMAYYCYGLVAAITHTLIMLSGFLLILKRLQKPSPEGAPLYRITWQTFLIAWCGLLFWWLPGHAMIGEARGVILFFFFFGFMMACDRMLLDQTNEAVRQ